MQLRKKHFYAPPEERLSAEFLLAGNLWASNHSELKISREPTFSKSLSNVAILLILWDLQIATIKASFP